MKNPPYKKGHISFPIGPGVLSVGLRVLGLYTTAVKKAIYVISVIQVRVYKTLVFV